MKKTILGVFTAMAIINNVSAAEQKLPDPNREGGMPLMQALNERHSVKQFGDKAIDDQTLSDLLWAAYGVNRSGGLRTIPTARKTLKYTSPKPTESGSITPSATRSNKSAPTTFCRCFKLRTT